MGKYWILFVLFLMVFQAASADSVQVSSAEGKTTITLNGSEMSAAGQIFKILDRSGAESTPTATGRLLSDDLISASVSYLRNEHYSATLIVNSQESSYGILPNRCAPAKDCVGRTDRAVLGGKVARELYEVMQRASFEGNNGDISDPVTCHETVLESGSMYHCSVALPHS